MDTKLPPVRLPVPYRLSLILVAMVMLLLPVLYLGLIASLGYLVYLHALYDTFIISEARGGRGSLLALALYVAPIVAGPVAVFFMIKPFFARPVETSTPLSVDRFKQPVLFRFVQALSYVVGAPAPEQIDVDCHVNASASLRRGFLRFFKNDLVLTIGLPLVQLMSLRELAGVLAHELGHFTQGMGMRATYVIRSINHWFARVVYGRDKWDEKLDEIAERSRHWTISVILLITRLSIWASRRVLWALMWVGNASSCLLLRQMEFDADRYEARIAGSNMFQTSIEKLTLMNMAKELAANDLRAFWSEKKLPDDLVALLEHHYNRLPDEKQKALHESILCRKTSWHDTHPSDKERIHAVQMEGEPGIYHASDPARTLFDDYEAVCISASKNHYQQFLGEAFARAEVLPTKQILQERIEDELAADARRRYFQNCYSSLKPLPINLKLEELERDVPTLVAKLTEVREALERQAEEAGQALMILLLTEQRLQMVKEAKQLVQAGLKIDAKSYELSSGRPPSVSDAVTEAQTEKEKIQKQVSPFASLASSRLQIALQILLNQRNAAAEPWHRLYQRAEPVRSVLSCLQQSRQLIDSLQEEYFDLRILLQNLAGNEGNESLVGLIRAKAGFLVRDLGLLHVELKPTPYPFKHASADISVADYAIEAIPTHSELSVLFRYTGQALDRLMALEERCLCRLARVGEEVEREFGLPPSPEPPTCFLSEDAIVTLT